MRAVLAKRLRRRAASMFPSGSKMNRAPSGMLYWTGARRLYRILKRLKGVEA